MNSRLPKWFFVAMLACAAIHFSRIYPQLPTVIASHFNAQGAANGWSTKEAFFQALCGVTALAAGLVFAISPLIAIVPHQFVNLPNKRYWLAPERAAAAHQFLSVWFAWFGCAVYGVILMGWDYAVKWNLKTETDPLRLWYVLLVFGAFTVFWSIRLLQRFARVPDDSQGPGLPEAR